MHIALAGSGFSFYEHRRAERTARPKIRFCGLGIGGRGCIQIIILFGDFGLLEAKRVSSNRQNRKFMSISVYVHLSGIGGDKKNTTRKPGVSSLPFSNPGHLSQLGFRRGLFFRGFQRRQSSAGMQDGVMTEGTRAHMSSFRSSTVSNCRVPAAALLTGAGYRRPATGSID